MEWCFTYTADLSVVTCLHTSPKTLSLSLPSVHTSCIGQGKGYCNHSCTYVLLGTILCSGEGSSQWALACWVYAVSYILTSYIRTSVSNEWLSYAEKVAFGTPACIYYGSVMVHHLDMCLISCVHLCMHTHMHVCAFMYDCLSVCVCVCVCVQVLVCMEFTS